MIGWDLIWVGIDRVGIERGLEMNGYRNIIVGKYVLVISRQITSLKNSLEMNVHVINSY